MEQKYYVCEICGNIISMVKNSGVPVVCCGRKMTEIVPGAIEASEEKHVPVYSVQDGVVSVTVGSAQHPMTPGHRIEWIALSTRGGMQLRQLDPSEPPCARFALCDGDEVVEVSAYCNLHGLWKAR